MERGSPLCILRQVVGHVLRQQNVAGIATIHDSLGDINASSREVWSIVNVFDLINRSAMNPHANRAVRMVAEHRRYFERAPRRLLRAFEKKKHHAIAGRKTDQFPSRFRLLKAFGGPNGAIQFLDGFDLLVSQESRKSNDINQQKMCNLEF